MEQLYDLFLFLSDQIAGFNISLSWEGIRVFFEQQFPEHLIDFFKTPVAFRALFASAMVGLMCGMLGCFIVLRNMALIGDALSHAVLPGVVVAFVIFGNTALGIFTGAVIAGLIAAIGITWLQQNINTKNDAAIGIVFTAMFAIGVMGISKISKAESGVHVPDLTDFLFGNVLSVSPQDVNLTFGIMIYVILSIIIFYRFLFATTFQPVIAETMGISTKIIHYYLMLLLSVAVVASLTTVGVILVVAMLITPAATALLLTNRLHWAIAFAGIIGVLATVVGFILAVLLNTTPGPAMTVIATLFYLLAALFSPSKGLVFRIFRKRKLQTKIQLEDTLKQALKLNSKGDLSFSTLLDKLEFNKSALRARLKTLQKNGFVTFSNNQVILTPEGQKEATKMVRAHRLWETYLVQEIGLTEEQIHEDAEKYEHLLTEELLDEVDLKLGFPTTDPHGSPIPKKLGIPDFPLINLPLLKNAKIAQQQVNEHITAQLWKLGLLPNTSFTIKNIEEKFIELEMEGKTIQLPKRLAQQVNILSQ